MTVVSMLHLLDCKPRKMVLN